VLAHRRHLEEGVALHAVVEAHEQVGVELEAQRRLAHVKALGRAAAESRHSGEVEEVLRRLWREVDNACGAERGA
jgi:hypothetical protein